MLRDNRFTRSIMARAASIQPIDVNTFTNASTNKKESDLALLVSNKDL